MLTNQIKSNQCQIMYNKIEIIIIKYARKKYASP